MRDFSTHFCTVWQRSSIMLCPTTSLFELVSFLITLVKPTASSKAASSFLSSPVSPLSPFLFFVKTKATFRKVVNNTTLS